MTHYEGRCEKANAIRKMLNELPVKHNSTLAAIVEIVTDKVNFYEQALFGWEQPDITERWGQRDIEIGKACCQAGLNMAQSIVNEMRIEFCH